MHEVVVWADPPTRELLTQRLFDPVIVGNADDFGRALARKPFLAFVEARHLPAAEPWARQAPLVAVVDESLPGTIELLERYWWLGHVIGASLLEAPAATEHLGALYASLRLGGADLRPFVGGVVQGRFARLLHSRSRPRRVEKLGQYLEEHGVGARKVQLLRDVGEELLTNAFYDAPAAAGLVQPIPRTQEVILTGPYSTELAYGVREDDLVFVRVRDLFGSLTRERLVSVLRRCAQAGSGVAMDESMGGAGLGLWRIFSAASFVAVSVVGGTSCDVLVGLYRRMPARSKHKETCSIHFFFDAHAVAQSAWGDAEPPVDTDHEPENEMDKSVALRI